MKRREILKLAAFTTGAAVSLPLVSSLFSGCKADIDAADVNYQLQFFTKEEMAWVRELANVILPKTDSPSASDVGVHRMIDTMVGKVYPKEDQEKYKIGMTALMQYLGEANATKKLSLLKELDGSKDAALDDARSLFHEIKNQSIAYYLSSEKIGKNYLNYLPVPGEYKACISLAEVGNKAWAL